MWCVRYNYRIDLKFFHEKKNAEIFYKKLLEEDNEAWEVNKRRWIEGREPYSMHDPEISMISFEDHKLLTDK